MESLQKAVPISIHIADVTERTLLTLSSRSACDCHNYIRSLNALTPAPANVPSSGLPARVSEAAVVQQAADPAPHKRAPARVPQRMGRPRQGPVRGTGAHLAAPRVLAGIPVGVPRNVDGAAGALGGARRARRRDAGAGNEHCCAGWGGSAKMRARACFSPTMCLLWERRAGCVRKLYAQTNLFTKATVQQYLVSRGLSGFPSLSTRLIVSTTSKYYRCTSTQQECILPRNYSC